MRLTLAAALADLHAIARRCRGPLPPEDRAAVTALLHEGRVAEARARDAQHRAPCGYDVNALVAAFPFDGQSREVRCPACGTAISFQSPLYEIEEWSA